MLSESFDDISEGTLKQLIESKAIVPIEEYELETILTENSESILQNSTNELYVVIQPSANCQLGCYYCGQSHTKDLLSDEYSELLIKRVEKKLHDGKYNGLYIGWFGGEPLMALNQIRQLTAQFLKITSSLGISYASKIVTNGLSLKSNVYEELVGKLGVKSLEVTLDGTAEFHDKHRYLKNGGSSFDLIYKNLTEIFSRPDYETLNCKISIRCNVDKSNWEGVSPLIKRMSEDKLQRKISYFYVVGIYSWGGNSAHSNSLTKEEFAKREIDWLIELEEAGFSPNILPQRHKQVCAIVNPDFEMYDSFGNVFNCTEVSLTDHYKGSPYALGNIKEPDKIASQKPLVNWNKEIIIDKFPCHSCKMLPVCGGGCPKSWHEDMRACPPSKFNIKEKLALSYVLSKAQIRDLL